MEKENNIIIETDTRPWYKTVNLTNGVALFLFLLTYLLNQLDRFLFGITAKSMAQEIHFGDRACMINTSFIESDLILGNSTFKCNAKTITNCTTLVNEDGDYPCKWDYNGQGLEYQIVAGPVFILVYTFAGIFISFAADKYNRKVMLAACLIFWSAMTLLTGFVNSYWQIVILRFGLGLGEAGCTPFAASMIADYFPKQSRALALGVYNWGIYIGYSMSYAFGNFITKANINNQGWRWSYFIAAIPGFIVGVLLFLIVKDPPKQQSPSTLDKNGQIQNNTGIGYKAKRVLTKFFNPSVILICLASSVRNSAGYVISYNTQQYFTDLGQTKQQIGDYMSWIPIVGGTFSVTIGGFLSDLIVKKLGIYSRVAVIIVSLVLAAPFAAGTLYFMPPGAYICQIPTYIFGEMWIGITIAVIVELIPADIRTTGIAVYLFIITNIGGNIQLLVPPLKDYFKHQFADHKENIEVDSLRSALYILYPGPYLYGAVVYVFVMLLMRRDQRRAEQSGYIPLPDSTS